MRSQLLLEESLKDIRNGKDELFEVSHPSVLYAASKRLLDVLGALIGLIILSPVMAIVAMLIKIVDSPGSVIFKAKRAGKDGKIFRMCKFRTMYEDSPAQSDSPTTPKDRRATKLGKLLRRTSLDELPQLWNVLKGDMSLVGPRPEQPFLVEKYQLWERRRLAVPQGMTGLWQISGRMDIPGDEMIRRDLIYVRMRSFLLDLLILLKTIPAVISGKGAY